MSLSINTCVLLQDRETSLRTQWGFFFIHSIEQQRKKTIIYLLRLAAHKEDDLGLYYPSGALCCTASSKKSAGSQLSHQPDSSSPGGAHKADGEGNESSVVDITRLHVNSLN